MPKAKKAPAKKAPAKKAAAKKAPAKKAVAKKAPEKKAVAKKTPAKKAPAKKAPKKKVWKPKAVETKAALIEELKASMGDLELTTKATNEIVNNLFEIISISIKRKKRLTVPGFGTFNVRKRKARMGRNPQTGEPLKIKASKTVAFKPTPKLKDIL